MKKISSVLLALVILFAMIGPAPVSAASPTAKIPTFSIVSVSADNFVTIRTHNFPAHDSFRVIMGRIGNRGRNGFRTATLDTGAGGSFTVSFDIPEELYGLYQIAIRLESVSGSGYFAYNWFYNNTSGYGTGGPYVDDEYVPVNWYGGVPTFSIVKVAEDESVTIRTRNFPQNDRFDVIMGFMGTRGSRGWKVDTLKSGEGGSFNATFEIPEELHGEYQIAIRLQSRTGSGYYAYNWFYNNASGRNTRFGTGGPYDDSPASTRWNVGYRGYPTMAVLNVTRNQTVKIRAYNLPSKEKFEVYMGYMGTAGVGGYYAGTLKTGEGGTQTYEVEIPEDLHGVRQIAIRIESISGSGLFAYNWFNNNKW